MSLCDDFTIAIMAWQSASVTLLSSDLLNGVRWRRVTASELWTISSMQGEQMEHPSDTAPVEPAAWEERLRKTTVVIARLGLAFLFFSQLFWKLPPRYGCEAGPGFAFTTAGADGVLVRTSGLCDWIGIESVYAQRPRSFFAIYNQDGDTLFSVPVDPLVRLNGAFVDGIVVPNFAWFGLLIFLAEAWIALSLGLGLFSRLGALVAIGIAAQLALGVGGAWDPAAQLQEWEWSYHLMVLLAIVLLGAAPGRVLGLDAWLRPRLMAARARGSRLARVLQAFT
jgi:hypothetical protein